MAWAAEKGGGAEGVGGGLAARNAPNVHAILEHYRGCVPALMARGMR